MLLKLSLAYACRCDHRTPAPGSIPPCYIGEDWRQVTLTEFINCSSNLAWNRQTRMLANLSLVNCYDHYRRNDPVNNEKMLQSAIENLTNLPYFGIMKYINESQFLLEQTFSLKFAHPLGDVRRKSRGTKYVVNTLDPSVLQLLRKRNSYDVRLYNFAKQLFFKRYEYARTIAPA